MMNHALLFMSLCFPLATEDEISKIIFKAPTTSCELDPIPTSLLKKAAHVIVPVVTKIFNNSLQSGTVFS